MNITKKPIVLVTGLSGMVGNRFQQLYGEAYEMVNLDLTSGIDITEASSVEAAFAAYPQALGVIHLAAFTNLNAAYEQTDDKEGSCYKVNVIGSKIIAETAARHHKYMIHVSTDYVYDGEKTDAYTETDIPRPIEWYGQTKLWADEAVMESGVEQVILRLAFPYQAKPMRPDLIAKIIDGLKTNTLYPMFTDHFITPTYVDDVARVFNYCVTNKPHGLYHMVGSSSHSDFEISELVKKVFNLPGEVKPGSLEDYLAKNPRPYQRTMRVSNQKLVNDFGIEMATLEQGLAAIKKQL